MFRMKWPEGYRCFRCRHDAYYVTTTRTSPLFECRRCGCQTTLTVGTIFEKTHTGLTTWFAAIYLVGQDTNVRTAHVSEQLEINYDTAWSMVRKIRRAIANPECVASAPRFDIG